MNPAPANFRWRRALNAADREVLAALRDLAPTADILLTRGPMGTTPLSELAEPMATDCGSRRAWDRRDFLGKLLSTAVSLALPRVVASAESGESGRDEARALLERHLTVDMHSHAGRVLLARPGMTQRPFEPVADPMRRGAMNLICLAVVSDTPVTRVGRDRRIRAVREPEPGELRAWSDLAFRRLHELAEKEELGLVTDRASLNEALRRPSIVVTSEGADFLEGSLEPLDIAFEQYRLRQLQLTHYRVNELGDIQTEPPQHNGLTSFGRAVVERCNALGIVVDLAHAPLYMVRQAIEVSSRPVILSHTSLAKSDTVHLSRTILPEHALAIASAGGVIGVWPPASQFPDLDALAAGIARMADVVGFEHVGIGTDMLGLTGPSTLASYAHLPDLASRLIARGFSESEMAAILGGNYVRVFQAVCDAVPVGSRSAPLASPGGVSALS